MTKLLLTSTESDLQSISTSAYDYILLIASDTSEDSSANTLSLSKYIDDNAFLIRSIVADSLDRLTLSSAESFLNKLLPFKLPLLAFTPLAEKSNFEKCPSINTITLLYAVRLFIAQNHVTSLHITNTCPPHYPFFSYPPYCSIVVNPFYYLTCALRLFAKSISTLSVNLLTIFKSILYLFELSRLAHSPIQSLNTSDQSQNLFVTFLNSSNLKNLKANSPDTYWGHLFSSIPTSNTSILFLLNTSGFASAREAFRSIQSFNQLPLHSSNFLLENLLTIPCILRITYNSLINYLALLGFLFTLLIKNKKTPLYLFLVYLESFLNPNVLLGWKHHVLLQRYLLSARNFDKCFFPYENHSWQFSLLSLLPQTCKTYGNHHSTVRFWDYRIFPSISLKTLSPLFGPNFLTVNSPLAYKTIIQSNYHRSKILQVEALRFFASPNTSSKLYIKSRTNLCPNDPIKKNILLIGSFSLSEQNSLVSLIRLFMDKYSNLFNLIYKPHPASPQRLSTLQPLLYADNNSLLPDLLSCSHFVISGAMTSVALESYLAGCKVAIYTQPGTLNLSPLAYITPDLFVTDLSSLERLIFQANPPIAAETSSLSFYLDSSLPKWLSILSDS